MGRMSELSIEMENEGIIEMLQEAGLDPETAILTAHKIMYRRITNGVADGYYGSDDDATQE